MSEWWKYAWRKLFFLGLMCLNGYAGWLCAGRAEWPSVWLHGVVALGMSAEWVVNEMREMREL